MRLTDIMGECSECYKEVSEKDLKWNDGLCVRCFDDEYNDPPIWAYYREYNWNKK